MRYEIAVNVFCVLASGGVPTSNELVSAADSLSAAAIEYQSGDYAMAYKSLKYFAKRGVAKLSRADKALAFSYARALSNES